MISKQSFMYKTVLFGCTAIAVYTAGAESRDAAPGGHAPFLLKEIQKNGSKCREFMYDSMHLSVSLFDISGRRIASLYGPELLHGGVHRIPLAWNGHRSRWCAGGVYPAAVNAGGEIKAFTIPNPALE